MEGVRGAGLQYGAQKSEFDLRTYEMEERKKAEQDALWAEILSSGIGALSSIFGMGQLPSATRGSAAPTGGGGYSGGYGGLGIGGSIYDLFGEGLGNF